MGAQAGYLRLAWLAQLTFVQFMGFFQPMLKNQLTTKKCFVKTVTSGKFQPECDEDWMQSDWHNIARESMVGILTDTNTTTTKNDFSHVKYDFFRLYKSFRGCNDFPQGGIWRMRNG